MINRVSKKVQNAQRWEIRMSQEKTVDSARIRMETRLLGEVVESSSFTKLRGRLVIDYLSLLLTQKSASADGCLKLYLVGSLFYPSPKGPSKINFHLVSSVFRSSLTATQEVALAQGR